MRPMETLQDLIEEAKVRTVCWGICIFAISYFLTHTSKSMWTNIPLSFLILAALRFLSYEVELRWRVRPIPKPTYLSHLEKKQLQLDDSHLSTVVTPSRWKKKIDSPLIDSAIDEFISKILQDFVIDLWYSSITPDKEAPELIRSLILDVLGEISGRLKEMNLVDLLTRDLVDLIGNQLDLYRKKQSEIGVNVMITLSSEERDEKLKHHLMASNELHPALFSPESEYKVIQRIIGGVLAISLNPQEAQCPLVSCFSRELLTCLVVQPILKFASPGYINELIEYMFLNNTDSSNMVVKSDSSNKDSGQNTQDGKSESRKTSTNFSSHSALVHSGAEKSTEVSLQGTQKNSVHHLPSRPADWAVALEATTKRRTEVLAPENLDNMWTKGRNYQKKTANLIKAGALLGSVNATSGLVTPTPQAGSPGKELVANMSDSIKGIDENYMVHLMHGIAKNECHISYDPEKKQCMEMSLSCQNEKNTGKLVTSNKIQLKRSSSTSDMDTNFLNRKGESTSSKENNRQDSAKLTDEESARVVPHMEGYPHTPKIKCRVVGAYFEKIGSKSFAVYSIAVTDTDGKTWFVKRRYRNFERLHRQLKDIPNYSLHLPPKRFLSSSIDDYFVHQRCILLDKYLQDLLSIANVAERHEVWDFLSVSSKNYSYGKSSSVMKNLAVNVDDAMDDIVRQFKGVSDGLMRKVVGPPSSYVVSPSLDDKSLSLTWSQEDMSKQIPRFRSMETSHSLSEDEGHDDDTVTNSGWHSDNELSSKSFPPRVVKRTKVHSSIEYQQGQGSEKFDRIGSDTSKTLLPANSFEDPVGMPSEWTPPNVSVPILNLVDKIFQLNRRGWLRRQAYWMSKQILQLIMEDAIDDWILRQIHWLRRDDVIAQGIRWVQDILWPNGTFIIKLGSRQEVDDFELDQKPSQGKSKMSGGKANSSSSFQAQLEAARRADYIKKMLLGGAPTALVSLIGSNQYRRCARDIYYFLQSTVCIKQLAYTIFEMVIVSVFPELRELLIDIHETARKQSF
ncbi:uncharacterized protein LOC122041219 isoform X1 [Zingiber officinale]|uniref:uncharacterized protein LOC122041219 isoform X1 n=1 Tax=Zingiber officinale TaxID=94328 RepID=UPI001C4C524D|nr:uncharacterized protein LOC122041219 isoform X1 [Zingiber officinale]